MLPLEGFLWTLKKRKEYLFTREEILKSLELFVKPEKLNEGPSYSSEVVKNRVKLCNKFIAAVHANGKVL